MGTTADLSDGWTVTILESIPSAWSLIEPVRRLNDPPDLGRQYFMVRIEANYDGEEESDSFYSSLRLLAVTESGFAYDGFTNGGCASLPDALPIRPVYQGEGIEGTICWHVRSDLADSLVVTEGPSSLEDYTETIDEVWLAIHP
jgi:hypothetical protein